MIVTRDHTCTCMSPCRKERVVLWVCYSCDIIISVKVSLLLCFKSLNISALEDDRKEMAFDLRVVVFTRSYYKIDPKLLQNQNGGIAS